MTNMLVLTQVPVGGGNITILVLIRHALGQLQMDVGEMKWLWRFLDRVIIVGNSALYPQEKEVYKFKSFSLSYHFGTVITKSSLKFGKVYSES